MDNVCAQAEYVAEIGRPISYDNVNGKYLLLGKIRFQNLFQEQPDGAILKLKLVDFLTGDRFEAYVVILRRSKKFRIIPVIQSTVFRASFIFPVVTANEQNLLYEISIYAKCVRDGMLVGCSITGGTNNADIDTAITPIIVNNLPNSVENYTKEIAYDNFVNITVGGLVLMLEYNTGKISIRSSKNIDLANDNLALLIYNSKTPMYFIAPIYNETSNTWLSGVFSLINNVIKRESTSETLINDHTYTAYINIDFYADFQW